MSKMHRTYLSTADVARLFNVTETTIKRWSDDGTLQCHKTPGGHHKFLVQQVSEFARAHEMQTAGALDLPSRDSHSKQIQIGILLRDYGILTGVFIEKTLSRDA